MDSDEQAARLTPFQRRQAERAERLADPQQQAVRERAMERVREKVEAEQAKALAEKQAAQAAKVRENKLRRMAERQGLALSKSRRRDPRSLGYGRWWLREAETDKAVHGGRIGWTLDEVEAFLTGGNDGN